MSGEELLGHWRNTEAASQALLEVVIKPDPDGEHVRALLRIRSNEGEHDWPSVRCELFECHEEDSVHGWAALGLLELDAMQVELQLRLNKGILCVMTWTRFRERGRRDYVVRELFARVEDEVFVGTWKNTDTQTRGVETLVFDQGMVRAWAAGGPESGGSAPALPIALGQAKVELFAARDETQAIGFSARLGEVFLQGNLNRGLMILAAYRMHAGSGRFSREFFARHTHESRPPPRAGTQGVLFERFGAADHDPREFVGTWTNSDPDHGDLLALDIRLDGWGLALGVEGSGRRLPQRWPSGEARIFAYYDESGRNTLLLLGSFELPEGRSDLQIKVTNGTAVVACFHARSPRSWFVREFLRRAR